MDGTQADTHFNLIRVKLEAMKAAEREGGLVSEAVRKDRLTRALQALMDHETAFIEAISDDFSHRSKDTTLFADVYAGVSALRQAIMDVGKWMKPEKRPLMFPLGLLGAKAYLLPQQKGVVGLITPWNFPLTMVFVPLAQMLAAGNRVMIKPSEHTPKTSALFAQVFAQYFDASEICVIEGGVEVSEAFARQDFDHLMFTGSPAIGKHVMRAAAENLVPVTLELGGKSPVIVGETADLDLVAERVATIKLMNAGQICLAPDYINLPAAKLEAFEAAYKAAVARMYPTMRDNADYTAIISERHKARISGYLDEAAQQGARVVTLEPEGETNIDADARKLAPALVFDPQDEMRVMQEEIFGPILPVRTYEHIDDVIDYVNARPRPLALYYFGQDAAEEKRVLARTHSGGVTINDCLFHGGYETLPFGGIGNSGMGVYHGIDGFREFSHLKPVVKHPKTSVTRLMGLVPPYGDKLRKLMRQKIGRRP